MQKFSEMFLKYLAKEYLMNQININLAYLLNRKLCKVYNQIQNCFFGKIKIINKIFYIKTKTCNL